ncbi:MAG: hypothetical protein EOO40_08725 [Deltaproteobacteria bacterium]|nr:MAG: hypothetical protein EOO40_08725 [Deltaproteobacteria bacterium]
MVAPLSPRHLVAPKEVRRALRARLHMPSLPQPAPMFMAPADACLPQRVQALQAQPRCRPGIDALQSFAASTKAGLLGGALLGLYTPLGIGALVTAPLGLVAGAIMGAGVGAGTAARRIHHHPPRPTAVRTHALSELRIVGSRRQSAHVMHQLQRRGALSKDGQLVDVFVAQRTLSQIRLLSAALRPDQQHAILQMLMCLPRPVAHRA